MPFRVRDEGLQEGATDTVATSSRGHVDADLGDAGVDAAARHRTQRRPPEDQPFVSRDQPTDVKVTGVPLLPAGCFGLKGRRLRGDTLDVYGADTLPVLRAESI